MRTKIIHISSSCFGRVSISRVVFLFASFVFLCTSLVLAQESKVAKIDTIQTTNSNQPNAPQVEEGDVKITDGTNTLIRITDEGTYGAIEIKTGVPSTTTDKLYNDAGTLKFNGSSLGGSGATSIDELTDAKAFGTSYYIGLQAGFLSSSTDYRNTALGYNSLYNNDIGEHNTAIGDQTLVSNTTGSSNTAVGYNSLFSNVAGVTNTAVGSQALANSLSSSNTAIGYKALYANINGSRNIALGSQALLDNTIGIKNVALGSLALHRNITGSNNIGIGEYANRNNEDGSNNTIIGYLAGGGGVGITHSKSGNVFLGYQAGYDEYSDNKLYIENSSSADPLIWGDFATNEVKINGDFEVTGDKIALGTETEVIGDYSTAIGRKVKVTGSGSMFLGDNSSAIVHNTVIDNIFNARFANGYKLFTNSTVGVGALLDAGANSWTVISDSTKKENFQSVDGEELLNKISHFKLTSWNYKSQDPTKFRHYGPMAQEFFNAFGNDGIGIIGNDTTIASADFDGINLIAIQALETRTKYQGISIKDQVASIKTQDERIKILEEENENLKAVISENNDLRNEINIIKAALSKLVIQQPKVKVSKK